MIFSLPYISGFSLIYTPDKQVEADVEWKFNCSDTLSMDDSIYRKM